MDKLIIGRYIVGDSFIHRLDPRSKFIIHADLYCYYLLG